MSGLNVFNNQQRSGYDEIVSYSPRYWLDIREMVAIWKFAGWTVDLMAQDMEGLEQAQFIAYMSEASIARMEKFLGIPYYPNKSLSERRAFVQAIWTKSGKMSKDKITEIINAFAECACTVELKNSEIVINMTFTGDPSEYIDDIRTMIEGSIPAHLGLLFKGNLDQNIVFTWTNHVILNRIIHHMYFFMYYAPTDIFLDGSWYLDGSVTLKNGYYIFPMGTGWKFQITILDGFTGKTVIPWYVSQNEAVALYFTPHVELTVDNTNESFETATIHRFGDQISESDSIHLIMNSSLWYLDGTYYLDGTNKLAAKIEEEDI